MFSIKGILGGVKMNSNDKMLSYAKEVASSAINKVAKEKGLRMSPLKSEDMYIVWFSKTLQNWKALVFTDRIHSNDANLGDYVEVTHNGDKNETYCDVYKKQLNVVYKDGE